MNQLATFRDAQIQKPKKFQREFEEYEVGYAAMGNVYAVTAKRCPSGLLQNMHVHGKH